MNTVPVLFGGVAAWQRLGLLALRMNMTAAEVIWRRSLLLSQGTMTPAQWTEMILEKNTALVTAAERATVKAIGGGTAAAVATAALAPYGTRTRANLRALRRR